MLQIFPIHPSHCCDHTVALASKLVKSSLHGSGMKYCVLPPGSPSGRDKISRVLSAGGNPEPRQRRKSGSPPPSTFKDLKQASASRCGKSPSGKEDAKLCPYFNKGNCNKGDKCDMWHGLSKQCIFFKKGKCMAGDKCIYQHYDKNGKQLQVNTTVPPGSPPGQGNEEKDASAKAKAKADPKKGKDGKPLNQ